MISARPDNDLGCGDHDHHEREDLALLAVEETAVGDQRNVGGVEHQLDAHEDNDRVAPDEHAHGADREQERGEPEQERKQIWIQHLLALRHRLERLVRYTAPMAATSRSIEVISKGSR